MKHKKIIAIFTSISLFVLTSCQFFDNFSNNQITTKAGTLIDNVYYRITGEDTCEVTQFYNTTADIKIKSEVEIDEKKYTVNTITNYSYEESLELPRYSFKNIYIPDSITKIKKAGLAYLTNVKELELPSTIQSLERGCLYELNLSKLSLPSYCSDYGAFYSSDMDVQEFYDKYYGNILYLPDCFDLYESRFYHNTNITIDEIVINGGEFLFGGSFSFVKFNLITISKSINKVYGDPFYGDGVNINFDDINDYLNLEFRSEDEAYSFCSNKIYINRERIKKLIIPEGVKNIPSYAFYGFDNFESVYFPDSLESIGVNAFKTFSGVETNYFNNGFYIGNDNNPYLILLYVSYDIKYFKFHDDCKIFLDSSFDNALTTIEEVVFNDKIKVIPDYTFYKSSYVYANNFKYATFKRENNIEKVGKCAFCKTNLREFVFGKNIKMIGESAFDSNALEKFEFPFEVNDLIINDFPTSNGKIIFPRGLVNINNEIYIDLSVESIVFIPKSLKNFSIDFSFNYFMYQLGGVIKYYNPIIVFEGTENDYSDVYQEFATKLKESVPEEVTTNLKVVYSELIKDGYLFNVENDSVIFNGFLRQYNEYKSLFWIPNSIYGMNVETIKLDFKDTQLMNRNFYLNSNCKTLYLTEFTPTKIYSNNDLENIINTNETTDTKYDLIFEGDESEFKVKDVPENVNVIFEQ